MRQEKPVGLKQENREAVLDVPHALKNIGPYEVHERLGSGGMGEVYKAYDQRLERWVAIKRIRPDKETAEEHRERLRREARAAARINHPAIVQVYDIFEQDDADCIVMEFVEGTSLDRLIQHGPLDAYRAARLGRQIANGLAQAHDNGILHRDLKTENVIVTAGDQAKILDFGLAKPLIQGNLDSTLTGKGQVVGTSRTMSPEYVSGDEVDHRSDLFALGVLLYETTTGNSPFKAHNTLATLKRVILHRQPPAHEVNPAIPQGLSELIDSLLEKEPQDRPQDAEEVANALGIFVGGSSASIDRPSTASGSFTGWQPPQRSNKFWWLVAVLMIAALAFTFWLGRRDADVRRGSAEEPFLLVLSEFVNETGDENLDGLNEPLRIGLTQSDSIEVLSTEEVRESLGRMQADPDQVIDRSIAIEIAEREGGGGVVIGRIDRIGTDSPYTLSAEVVAPRTGRTIFASNDVASLDSEIVPALGRIVESLVDKFAERGPEDEGRRQPLERVTTSSTVALRSYSKGITFFERNDFANAIPLFEEAIDLDPGFAMARAKLGTAYRNSGRDPEQAIRHLERALELKDRLTLEESLYVRSWVATLRGRPAEAVQAWAKMRELLPQQSTAHQNYALASWTYFNRFQDAAEAFERAVSVGGGVSALYHLGYCQLGLDRLDEAEESFRLAWEEGEFRALFGLVDANLARGRFAEAQKLLSSTDLEQLPAVLSPNLRTLETRVTSFNGDLARTLEQATEIVRTASDNNAAATEHKGRLLILGILSLTGQSERFQTELSEAIERVPIADFRNDVGGDASKALLLAAIGKIAARAGSIEDAESTLSMMQPFLPKPAEGIWRAHLSMLQAEIAIARGDTLSARHLLEGVGEQNETFTGTETLAYLTDVRGEHESAQIRYQWLSENPGRALAECAGLCFDRPNNILALPRLRARLAELKRATGANDEADRILRMIPEKWRKTLATAPIHSDQL